ncbi:MAG: hypothetical protein R3C53_14590 [Pirellulaceae bacterium]
MAFQRTTIFILLLACCLRLAAAAYVHRQNASSATVFRFGDSDSYWVLGSQIAQGKPYQYGSEHARIFRAPLMPILLAPFTVFEDQAAGVWWARVLGCLLGTFAVWEVMLLTQRLGGGAAATIAGLIAACSPSAIGMSVVVLSEILLVPLMLLHLLLWQSAWLAKRKYTWVTCAMLAGMVAGTATLARPSWLLFTPFLTCVGLLVGPQRIKHLQIGAVTMLGIAMVMTPWWIRNAQITGRFVLTTLQVGPSLYDGLHAGASGASDEGMAFMQQIVAEQIAEDARTSTPLEGTLEYRVNRRAQRLAVAWALGHPAEVLRLSWVKFCRMWTLWPAGAEVASPSVRLGITLGSFGILLLAIVATLINWKSMSWNMAICWLPCLYFTLLHMVFVSSIRYREPAVVVLAALAGCAIAKFLWGDRIPTGRHGRDIGTCTDKP